MKKLFSMSLMLLFAVTLITCAADNKPAKKTNATVSPSAKIEVYYFHFTRRCVTCQAVETESQKAIMALYSEQVKQGKVRFTQVNLDNADSAAFAKKLDIYGQTLLVISGDKRFDLTDKGFMYAYNSPEKLKAELKKVIDLLL